MKRLYVHTTLISSLMLAFLLSSTAHAATTQVSSSSSPQTFTTAVNANASFNFTGSFELIEDASLTISVNDTHNSNITFLSNPPVCGMFGCMPGGMTMTILSSGIDYRAFTLTDSANNPITGTSSTLFNGAVMGLDSRYNSTFSFSNLAAGQYGFSLGGYAYTAGNASFTVATIATPVTTPVPEPETLGMLMLGLGFISVALRRKHTT